MDGRLVTFAVVTALTLLVGGASLYCWLAIHAHA